MGPGRLASMAAGSRRADEPKRSITLNVRASIGRGPRQPRQAAVEKVERSSCGSRIKIVNASAFDVVVKLLSVIRGSNLKDLGLFFPRETLPEGWRYKREAEEDYSHRGISPLVRALFKLRFPHFGKGETDPVRPRRPGRLARLRRGRDDRARRV